MERECHMSLDVDFFVSDFATSSRHLPQQSSELDACTILSLFLLKQSLHCWWLQDTCPAYHSVFCAFRGCDYFKLGFFQAFVLNHICYPGRSVEEPGCPESRSVAAWHIYWKLGWVRERGPCLDTSRAGSCLSSLLTGTAPSSLVCFTIKKKENYVHRPRDSILS